MYRASIQYLVTLDILHQDTNGSLLLALGIENSVLKKRRFRETLLKPLFLWLYRFIIF